MAQWQSVAEQLVLQEEQLQAWQQGQHSKTKTAAVAFAAEQQGQPQQCQQRGGWLEL